MGGTEQITAEERAYYQRVVQQLRTAQAIAGSYGQYLAERYHLGPQDEIAEDGTIHRPSPPRPTPLAAVEPADRA